MDNIEEKLSNLIGDLNFEKLELELKIPNFFSILNASRTEIRHSNFLGWILDPNGTHGMGDIFLRKFLRDIFSDEKVTTYSQFDVDSFDLRTAEVRREWKHIDILIVLPDIVVAVENKIDSQDHSNQLKKYRHIVDESFPKHHKSYVYLTPYGNNPNDEESSKIYVNYSYEQLSDLLARILEIYRDSLNNRVALYLQDYLTILRRELMQNDPLNKIAVKVYETHSEALDFIFENRPDPLNELFPYFDAKIKESKWVLGSCHKGYVRFMTAPLKEIIPVGYHSGWTGRESFLFQIDYYNGKNVIFNTVIPPGDSTVKNILSQALETIQGHKKPQGKQWFVHFVKRWPFVANEIVNEPEDKIRDSIDKFWPEIKDIVGKVEEAIMKEQDALKRIKNKAI